MKETMPHETIQLKHIEYSENNFGFEGLNKNSKTVAFRGDVNFVVIGIGKE